MFLATTALQEFWDSSKEILFLGSWCFTADSERLDLQRPSPVMPSPWDDRDRYYDAVSYVDSCSEDLLHELHEYLNRIHGTNHSERYWRIVLGPWVILYTTIIYDRFIHLQSAFQKYKNLETMVMHESSFRVPADFNEAHSFAQSDPYNLQIFSQLLKWMNFSFPAKAYEMPFGLSKTSTSARDRVFSLAESIMRLPFRVRARATIRKTNLSLIESWKLSWATGFRALPLDFSLAGSFQRTKPVFGEARCSLGNLPWNNEFQRILTALLPSHFPTLYLEGYLGADERISRAGKTSVLVSGYAWSGDEEMKFYAARGMETGTHLVAVQHGGGYGVYRAAPYELHERRLSDSFLAWGWADGRSKNSGNVVNPRFLQLENETHRGGVKRAILFITTGTERYLHRFYSSPVGSQWDGYYDWQSQFLTRLTGGLQSSVIFRPYPADYRHRGQRWIRTSFPSLTWDDSPRSINERFATARVIVIDHLGTALLEALASNIPTILFWDPNRWEVRAEAAMYFERLRQARILWHSPADAAGQLAEIYEKPGVWWNEDGVQAARREFADRYAFTKQDWTRSWIANLNHVSNGKEKFD